MTFVATDQTITESHQRIVCETRQSLDAYKGWVALSNAIHLAACAALISRFQPRNRQGYQTGIPPHQLWLALVYTEAAWAGVSPVAVIEGRRLGGAITARYRAYRVLRLMGYSLPGIGRVVGRDHSTIMYGLRKLGEWTRPEDLYQDITP